MEHELSLRVLNKVLSVKIGLLFIAFMIIFNESIDTAKRTTTRQRPKRTPHKLLSPKIQQSHGSNGTWTRTTHPYLPTTQTSLPGKPQDQLQRSSERTQPQQ
jgi:hypothetical protein